MDSKRPLESHENLFAKLEIGSRSTGLTETLEPFDEQCDICKVNGKKTSVGYCQHCCQYLCKTCCDHHGKILGTKHHKVFGKDAVTVFGRETLFGRKLIPSEVITVPALPSTETPAKPQIKYVNFFRDIDKMIVVCWYPNTKFYGISELKENKQERYSIGLVNESAICLDMENNQILNVKQKDKTVLEIDISEPMFKERELFKTSGECQAIVEFDNGFAAAIKMPTMYAVPEWQIQYLSREGRIKQRLSYDADGNGQFSNPKALASNHTQNTLYVLDDGKNNIKGFNIAGELLFTFTHDDMSSPKSLVVDKEDNIYVACANRVLQVNKEGKEHVVAIKNKNLQKTEFVAFNSAKELLLVGDGTENLQYFTFV